MKITWRNIIITLVMVLTLVVIWYFFDLAIYLFLASILALVGYPLASRMSKLRIGKRSLPLSVASAITVLIILVVMLSFLATVIPLIAYQVDKIAQIDFNQIALKLDQPLKDVEGVLKENKFMSGSETLAGLVTRRLSTLLSFTSLSTLVSSILVNTGTFLFALSTILFLTFFFIKDEALIRKRIFDLLPDRHSDKLMMVIDKIKGLLSRYFVGVVIEIVSVITLITVGLLIFGVEGAVLLGIFGGFMNIIPYLGPIIGTVLSCILGIITVLATGDVTAILPTLMKIIGVFVAANLVDNMILQPIIFSTSVKAHPVEIFLVIIMGGTLAGIAGMIFAIPVYTIVRTIGYEVYQYLRNNRD